MATPNSTTIGKPRVFGQPCVALDLRGKKMQKMEIHKFNDRKIGNMATAYIQQ